MRADLRTVRLICFGLQVHLDHLDELMGEMCALGLVSVFPARADELMRYYGDLRALLEEFQKDAEEGSYDSISEA